MEFSSIVNKKLIIKIKPEVPFQDINQLVPLLPGEVIIDGGSFKYHHTNRLCEEGDYFVVNGVSGDDKEALYSPSLLSGSHEEA